MSLGIAVRADREKVDFEEEARLDDTFDFTGPLSRYPLAPRFVFLTGSTGVLGAYLLEELLRRTDADLYCLVRASDDEAARTRLVAHLQSYGIWQEEHASRIRALAGDVSEPLLGLSFETYQDLAERIDVIYHSAGWLNMAMPYARLKATNVTGTKQVLRLAGTTTVKPVHFVSSIAVFYTDPNANGPLLTEEDAPRYHPSLRGGYSKSKWVADRMISYASERGLPTTTYRPIRIMGHSVTGAMHDASDMLPLLLKGCLLLGKYPALDMKVTMVPVDYVSQAMVHLASQKKSWGRAFHFFNHSPVDWEKLMSMLRSYGYPLERTSYDQWWRELKQQSQNTAEKPEIRGACSTLLLALSAPHFLFYKRPPMDDRHTREGLEGTGIVCAPVDFNLISTYVSFWREIGYLPAPEAVSAIAVA